MTATVTSDILGDVRECLSSVTSTLAGPTLDTNRLAQNDRSKAHTQGDEPWHNETWSWSAYFFFYGSLTAIALAMRALC